jgi:hypothetical protein
MKKFVFDFMSVVHFAPCSWARSSSFHHPTVTHRDFVFLLVSRARLVSRLICSRHPARPLLLMIHRWVSPFWPFPALKAPAWFFLWFGCPVFHSRSQDPLSPRQFFRARSRTVFCSFSQRSWVSAAQISSSAAWVFWSVHQCSNIRWSGKK